MINNHHESAYTTSTAMKEHEDTDKTDIWNKVSFQEGIAVCILDILHMKDWGPEKLLLQESP